MAEVARSMSGERPAEHRVADHAADQVQLEAGGVESLAELLRHRVDIDHGHHAVTIPFDLVRPAALP